MRTGHITGGVALLAVVLITTLSPQGASARPGPAGESAKSKLRLQTVTSKLRAPVHVTDAPGRGNRRLLFVSEQRGVVRVVRRGRLLRKPFLDLRKETEAVGERGLLSIAFDPGYRKNRRLYAYYTDDDGTIRVSQFRRSPRSKTRARARAREVISIPHPLLGHNGGTAAFGPDGMLYLAPGDGGAACDPDENAQDPGVLLGKLLRIDPLPGGGYRIPADNPFTGVPGARGEVYSVGLRNPFRFSFDRRTGTIAIGDVGQHAWEEINYETLAGARGANFGWDALEGTHPLDLDSSEPCSKDSPTPVPAASEPPIHEYPHPGPGGDGAKLTGCSVTGGIVVRDRKLGQLEGRYLFADHCGERLRSFRPSLDGAGRVREHGLKAPAATSFLSGRKGRVYLTTILGDLLRVKR